MSRTVDVDQSKMMREATLGFFVLVLLLGVLAFTIYAKATGLFTATAAEHMSPARLVELDANGEVILPTPKSQLLVPLPDNESNSIVNLDSMKRISADQLFGNSSDSVRVASSDPALEDSASTGELLDAIPDRPDSLGPANEIPKVADAGLPGPVFAGQPSAAASDTETLSSGLPEAKVAAVPESSLLGNESDNGSVPETTPSPLPQPTLYQKLSEAGSTSNLESSPNQLTGEPAKAIEAADDSFPSLPNALRAETNPAESQNSLPSLPVPPLRSPSVNDQGVDDEGATLIAPVTPETNLATQVTHTEQIGQSEKTIPPSLPNTLRPPAVTESVETLEAANAIKLEAGQLDTDKHDAGNLKLANPELDSLPAGDLDADDSGNDLHNEIPRGLPNELRRQSPARPSSTHQSQSHQSQSLLSENANSEDAAANEKDDLSMRLQQAAEMHADEVLDDEADLAAESMPALSNPVLDSQSASSAGGENESSDRADQDVANDPSAAGDASQAEAEAEEPVAAVRYSQSQIRGALRMVEMQANENLSDVANRVYGSPEWAVAMFQLNRHRASSTGQFAVGTQIMFLPKPMMEFLYPDKVPQQVNLPAPVGQLGQENVNPIDTVDYNQPVPSPKLLLYRTKGGETLFGLAAEYLGQASRFSELLELNQTALQNRWGHLDPLPSGLQLRFPAE